MPNKRIVNLQPGAEIIPVANDLRAKVREIPGSEEAAIRQAEAALADLSAEFKGWIDAQSGELLAALSGYDPGDPASLDALFSAAHDLKGLAATLGYPLAGEVASDLCRLVEARRDGTAVPDDLIRHHVAAIRAIIREGAGDGSHPAGRTLAAELRRHTEAAIGAEAE